MLNLIRKAKISLNEKEIGSFYEYILGDWIKMLSPICPHISEELWEQLGNKTFASLEKWPEIDEGKIKDKFDIAEKALDQTVSDIVNILKIIKDKQGKDGTKIYLYAIPKEIENYNSEEIGKRVGLDVKVFAVNDSKKYDPQGKALKAKFGRPSIYIE